MVLKKLAKKGGYVPLIYLRRGGKWQGEGVSVITKYFIEYAKRNYGIHLAILERNKSSGFLYQMTRLLLAR